MTNDEIKKFALELLRSDSEEEVIEILKKEGYWDEPKLWRLFGDREGNYSIVGNQQSKPEAALTEKIINGIDSRLMSESLARGINPESNEAPSSVREAVARFFEDKEITNDEDGDLQRWDNKKRLSISEGICVAMTGDRKRPCVTISDTGEGQTPKMMPETFLSIDRQNKLRIFFVQGKFNMGGTGVLEFCGSNNLQLIITKRNPNIVKATREIDESSDYWGLTVVRIQSGQGRAKNSVYTYLAPVGSKNSPYKGEIISFKSKTLPLLPHGNDAYVREVEWGSTLKMYNYDMKGFSSHACMKDGLLYRLEAMLPEPALPVRIYECRDFRGHAGSFATTLSGLKVRLEDNKAENLENGFPDAIPFMIKGEEMLARVYAFKKGKADTYRTNEGIIFTINGQTHGTIPKTIFSRKSVKMGRLADSLLVLIDCSRISNRTRERLFMNSRDRLRNNELRKALESQLEDIIHRHEGLRELRERRRSQEIEEKLDDSQPLEEVLQKILKSSPSLSSLFLAGNRLSRPYKKKDVGDKEGDGGGVEEALGEYVGKTHPSYFRFKKKQYGELLARDFEIGRKCRIDFETDVENEYFTRDTNHGRCILKVIEDKWDEENFDWNLRLYNGLAHLSVDMPENIVPGEEITLELTIEDDVVLEPFVNIAVMTARSQKTRPGGGRPTTTSRKGGKGEKLLPAGIKLPNIIRVREEKWNNDFDQYSALRIVQGEDESNEQQDVYEFYVNVDNLYLRTDMKHAKDHPRLLEDKFVYGNVLIGLGLIKGYRAIETQTEKTNGDVSENGLPSITNEHYTIERYVSDTTRAISPIILPMINSLGALSEEDVTLGGEIGDDE